MTLTVMSYNIKTGGYDGARPARLDALVRVVAGHAPDVLALQELHGFARGGERLMRRFASAVGMRPFLARSVVGQPVAVLLRPPLVAVAAGPVRRPFHHAAMRVTVDTGGGPLTVIGTHLHPFSGWRRLHEARWLARYAGRDRMVLLLGDPNTLDPWTDHAGRVAALPVAYRSRHLRRDGAVDTRAVGALAAAGFVDLFRHVGKGAPDTAPTTRGGGAEFSGMRLDYMLATAPVAALATCCRVVRGGDAEWASDHYPVLGRFNLSPAGGGRGQVRRSAV